MGFLSRFGRPVDDPGGFKSLTRTTVKQNFKIRVPKDKAETVQHALERWVQSQGWAAVIDSKLEGDTVKLSFRHDESMPGKPPQMDAGSMTDELQKVLQDALKQEQQQPS